MWKPSDPLEGSWPLWANNSCHRHLLRELWQKADTESTTFISIDCEYDNTKICELGLTVQTKNEEPIRRNIIVSADRRSKEDNKRFGFGSSEYVKKSSDLFPILYKLFRDQKCGTTKWYSGVKLEDGLREFNIEIEKQAPLHNGGNDSWYTMKLLFCKAQRDAETQQRPMPKENVFCKCSNRFSRCTCTPTINQTKSIITCSRTRLLSQVTSSSIHTLTSVIR
ncbi:hypothetical protein LA080_000609 [Diaporthe eres]|nr:hypothetical protein LA080_000609 [Diaporthe eres]